MAALQTPLSKNILVCWSRWSPHALRNALHTRPRYLQPTSSTTVPGIGFPFRDPSRHVYFSIIHRPWHLTVGPSRQVFAVTLSFAVHENNINHLQLIPSTTIIVYHHQPHHHHHHHPHHHHQASLLGTTTTLSLPPVIVPQGLCMSLPSLSCLLSFFEFHFTSLSIFRVCLCLHH